MWVVLTSIDYGSFQQFRGIYTTEFLAQQRAAYLRHNEFVDEIEVKEVKLDEDWND